MRAAAALAALVATAAGASQPVGGTHGAWHVTSIASLSGTEGGDAALSLTQENGATEFEARWYQDQGPFIRLWFEVDGCTGEDDYTARYDVLVTRWLATPPRTLARRVGRDLAAWSAQAALACDPGSRPGGLRRDGLEAAVKDFTRRLAYLWNPR